MLYKQIEAARTIINARIPLIPRFGLILGSGLNALADELEQAMIIAYSDIPGFVTPTIAGHRGELVIGYLGGQCVAVMCGRLHFYEGYTMQEITFPVRVLHALGCTTLFVTNAAGGLHSNWHVGDIMQITDQIFLPGMAGQHPLRGPHDERLGPRFPAMVGAFKHNLTPLIQAVAAQLQLTLREGVYLMLSGPHFESAAELRMARIWGADAVGMSTAPEVIVAVQMGMRIVGFSLITNLALPDGDPANHAEVMAVGETAKPKFAALIRGILEQIKIGNEG